MVIKEKDVIPYIKEILCKKDINYTELGLKLGVSKQYIQKLMTSREDRYIRSKVRILNELGIKAKYKKECVIFLEGA